MNAFFEALVNLNRPAKRAIQVSIDIFLIVSCFYLAMLLRLERADFAENPDIWISFAPVLVITILAFIRLGLYRSILRFISGQAFKAISTGVLISMVSLLAASQFLSSPIPRSVPFIYALLLIISIGGVRFFMRGLLRQPVVAKKQPVIIYGAGESGRQLQNALFHGKEYVPVAFVDDDPRLQNTLVSGLRVFPARDIPYLADRHDLHAILLAMPAVSRSRRREIIEQIEPMGLEIKTIPGMADIISGRATFSELRKVTPEDLLGRDPVPPRPDLMSRNITSKVVLVSGAGGSIGSELCRQIVKHNPAKLILLDHSEIALYAISIELREALARSGADVEIEPILGSVQNATRVQAILHAFDVQTIYHAAAYKHVVHVEENVVEGILNNVFGTKVIAEAAAAQGVESFILVSTDKAVRPTNFMGASKRMAELVCQSLAAESTQTTFSMVRFGNVLGSSGSVIPRFRAQIEKGGPVTVTHREITRYFMTIPEAAQLVIQAGAMARGGDVFVLDMGEPVKIFELAQSMIRLHGLKPYVIAAEDADMAERGDIGIAIVGLNKGEKLYEELLIGNHPKGTDHARIMTATEVFLPRDALLEILARLRRACQVLDIADIQRIFLEAPLAYQPNGADLHDLLWNQARQRGAGLPPRLQVVATHSPYPAELDRMS